MLVILSAPPLSLFLCIIGSTHTYTCAGHHVDIIRHGKACVSNGSLQLSPNSPDMTEGSGSYEMIYPMGNPLPTIPNDIDVVTVSWHANERVSKRRGSLYTNQCFQKSSSCVQQNKGGLFTQYHSIVWWVVTFLFAGLSPSFAGIHHSNPTGGHLAVPYLILNIG